jgi:hypothetical protein
VGAAPALNRLATCCLYEPRHPKRKVRTARGTTPWAPPLRTAESFLLRPHKCKAPPLRESRRAPSVPLRSLVALSLSRTLFSVGEAVMLHATLLAPVALVLLVNSFQSLFVFIIGIALTLLFPRLAKESLGRTKMLQKGVEIGLMLISGYLVSS